MKAEINNLYNYIKRNYKTIILILLIAIVSYSIKIFNYSISIDSEVTINSESANNIPWIATGRWGLVVLGKILHYGGRYNYFISNVVMITFFLISVVLTSYLFSRISKKENYEKCVILVLGLLIFTSPILCEMLNFTMMTAEIAIGFSFISISVLSSYIAVYDRKKIFYLISVFFLMFAMGIYQAFFPLYIGLVAFVFFVEKNEVGFNRRFRDDLLFIIKLVLIFVASYICCSLITKGLERYYNINPSGYLTNQIAWGKISTKDCIKNIYQVIKNIIIPDKYSLFFTYSYLFLIIVSFIYSVKIIIKRLRKGIVPTLCLCFILFSPFLIIMITASGVAIRTLMNIPFLTGLLFVFFLTKYWNNKVIRYMFIFVIVITSLIQYKCISDLLYSDYIRYQEDQSLVKSIFDKIDVMDGLEMDNREKTTVVFVGMYSNKSTGVMAKGDTMSYSFFEWDPATEFASNKRIYGLAQTLGYRYCMPTAVQVKKAQKLFSELDVYPAKNSIKVYDGMVVVRTS